MTPYEKVEQKALQLSNEEKERLIQSLTINLDETYDEQKIEQAWIKEIERRWDEIKSGKVKPIPARDALDQIR